MDNLIFNLILSLWASTWGKIALIAAVVIGLGLYAAVRWSNSAFKKQLTDLGERWPLFSWEALEWRVRNAAELYFHGWNEQNLDALRPHMTGAGHQQLVEQLDAARANQKYKRYSVIDFKTPELAELHLPNDEEPPRVVIKTDVPLSHFLSEFGVGEATLLFDLTYSNDGRWLVSAIRRDDAYSVNPDLENAPDTTWLESHSLPEPHPETRNPEPPARFGKRLRGTGKLLFGAWAKAIAMLAFIGAAGWLTMAAQDRTKSDELVREEGIRIAAKIVHADHNEEKQVSRIQYTFQLPSDSREFSHRNLFGVHDYARIDLDLGKQAEKTGQIPVSYLPSDPTKNFPVEAHSMVPSEFKWVVAFAVAVVLWILILEVRKIIRYTPRSFSFFWER